jgi:phospholipid-transporting ATPase
MSAANASDFAIGEFKLLKRLLFYHGRINLNRISKLILYFFYKNIIFTISQLFFCPMALSSGQTIFDDWYITCYNLIFTAVPLCISALTDFDVKEEDGKQVGEHLSELYKESRDEKKVFSGLSFMIMIIKGIIISLIMFVISIQNKILNRKGNMSDLWYLSLLYYLSILLVVTNHLFFITQYIIFLLPIVTFVSSFLLLCSFLLLVHYGLLFDFNSKATIFSSLGNISFYLYLFFILGFNAIFDYCLKVRVFYFDNSLSCELERSIIKEKRRKMSTKIKLTLKEKIGIKRSNSNSVEQSRLSLIKNNFNNIISQHDKISFFNKNNLSKMNDFKLSCLKKIDGQKHDNYLNINYNHPNDNSEYNEDKSDNEEDECDKE